MNGDGFVACRTLGHSWFSIEAEHNPKRPGGWYMKVRCERCGSERSDIVNRHGALVGRSYKPAPGYRRARGDGRVTRSEWRVQFLTALPTRRRRSA